MSLKYWKLSLAVFVLGVALTGGVWAQSNGEEQFPINDNHGRHVQSSPKARATQQDVKPVTPEIKAVIEQQLGELYEAYKGKQLEKVMGLLHEAFEASALEYAGRHPEDNEAKAKVMDGYLAFHEDIFNHKDYQLDPFTLEFCTFNQLDNGNVEVSSPIPIIGSKPMDFKDETDEQIHYVTTSLRLGRFIFAPGEKGWRIVEMDIF